MDRRPVQWLRYSTCRRRTSPTQSWPGWQPWWKKPNARESEMSLTLSLLMSAAVKATVILALAGLITAVWRTASASTRHLVWTIAVASAFVLPFAAAGIALIGSPRLAVPFEMPVAKIAVDVAP